MPVPRTGIQGEGKIEVKETIVLIGLTGGIGSGKGTAAKILAEFGAKIIDADVISRELTKQGLPLWREIVRRWGKQILKEDGEIDRKKLASIVFSSYRELEELNSMTHPAIIAEVNKRISENPDDLMVLVAPLLIEAGITEAVDYLWVVTLDVEKQIERIIQRDGCNREEAQARIQAQMPLIEKVKFADVIIDNSGTPEFMREQVVKEWKNLTGNKEESLAGD
ncbi:MAG: dephospho-CoA kinase [Firmicutes bacterium]|nr:dephospho-CoA kinase [Bacillota bacterium]